MFQLAIARQFKSFALSYFDMRVIIFSTEKLSYFASNQIINFFHTLSIRTFYKQ